MASIAVAACSSSDEICDPVAGTYQPLYMPMNGNCGPIANIRVPLDTGNASVKTHQEMQFDRLVTTEVIHKGCSVSVTQDVSFAGVLESRMQGEVAVHSSSELSGPVNFARFVNGDPTALSCAGTYNATFSRPDSVFQ
jgi:hypothetical protein